MSVRRARTFGSRVYSVTYRHADDGHDYKHDFKPGVELVARPNGSLELVSSSGKQLYADFERNPPMLFMVNSPRGGRTMAKRKTHRRRKNAPASHRRRRRNPPRAFHRRRARRNPPAFSRGGLMVIAKKGIVDALWITGGQMLGNLVFNALPASISTNLSPVSQGAVEVGMGVALGAGVAMVAGRDAGEVVAAGIAAAGIQRIIKAQSPALAKYLSGYPGTPRIVPRNMSGYPGTPRVALAGPEVKRRLARGGAPIIAGSSLGTTSMGMGY